jgi:hypothetical protein
MLERHIFMADIPDASGLSVSAIHGILAVRQRTSGVK